MIVLDAKKLELGAWSPGQAAVIAELRANGYAVELRPSHARLTSELELALQTLRWEPELVGVVAVFREGPTGVARVKTQRFGLQRLETELADGTLSRSRLALAVVDRVRLVEIPKLPSAALRQAPAAAVPVVRVVGLWLGAGVVNVGRGVTWPWLSASGSWLFLPPFALEASLGAAAWSSTVRTGPGDVALRAEQAMAYVAFEPFSGRRFSCALGFGGGVSVVHASAVSSADFAGLDRTARVASLGLRARGTLRSGHALISVSLEPGVLLPRVQVEETSSTLLSLGRPWLASNVAIGWSL